MNKILLGLLLGGALGAFDGLSALLTAPETRPEIAGIVLGSTFKGLIAGALIGWFARKGRSLPICIAFGTGVGFALAAVIVTMQSLAGEAYYWQILLPGSLVGLIVGYATQKYGRVAGSRPA